MSFEDAIQALSPDVYWRMDQADLNDPCLDYSGNFRNGVYETVANLTPGQPSIVPSNPNAVGLAIPFLSYSEGVPASYAFVRDTQDQDWWNHPVISASICYRKTSTQPNQFFYRRDYQLNSHRQFGLRYFQSGQLKLDFAKTDGLWYELDTVSMPFPIADGNEHIITVVIDLPGTRQEIWADGTLVIADTQGGVLQQPIGTYMTVGQARYNTAQSINGDVSHFVFGGRAWTSVEIQTLHQEWASDVILPPSPLPPPIVCVGTCPPGTPPSGDSVTCVVKP